MVLAADRPDRRPPTIVQHQTVLSDSRAFQVGGSKREKSPFETDCCNLGSGFFPLPVADLADALVRFAGASYHRLV